MNSRSMSRAALGQILGLSMTISAPLARKLPPVSRSLLGLNLPKHDKAVARNASVRALPVIKIA